jgi:Na+/melibiose symporter-like transporter
LGTGSFLVVPQLFLLFFMTDHLGIAAAWASLTLMLPKLWEFLSDPYIGMRSDRARTPWGHRHPFMLAGALLLSVGIAMVFNVPSLEGPTARWLYVTSMFVLATTGYALFIVPYTALLGEMTGDPHERTRVVALRMGFLGVSLLVAAIVWPEVLKAMGSTTEAYGFVGIGVGLLCLVATALTISGTRGIKLAHVPADNTRLGEQLRVVLSERAFVLLALSYGTQVLAQSVNSTVLAYIGKYISPLGNDFLPVYFGTVTVASVVAMGLWSVMARRWSKRQCFVAGTLVGIAGYLTAAFGLHNSTTLLLVGAALGGVGFAAGQVFGFSLLPDVIDQARRTRGVARDGAFTGVWVGWEKMGLATGATLAGLILGWSNFQSSTGQTVVQPASAIAALVWLFGLVPAALLALSIVPLMSPALRKLPTRT